MPVISRGCMEDEGLKSTWIIIKGGHRSEVDTTRVQAAIEKVAFMPRPPSQESAEEALNNLDGALSDALAAAFDAGRALTR